MCLFKNFIKLKFNKFNHFHLPSLNFLKRSFLLRQVGLFSSYLRHLQQRPKISDISLALKSGSLSSFLLITNEMKLLIKHSTETITELIIVVWEAQELQSLINRNMIARMVCGKSSHIALKPELSAFYYPLKSII